MKLTFWYLIKWKEIYMKSKLKNTNNTTFSSSFLPATPTNPRFEINEEHEEHIFFFLILFLQPNSLNPKCLKNRIPIVTTNFIKWVTNVNTILMLHWWQHRLMRTQVIDFMVVGCIGCDFFYVDFVLRTLLLMCLLFIHLCL